MEEEGEGRTLFFALGDRIDLLVLCLRVARVLEGQRWVVVGPRNGGRRAWPSPRGPRWPLSVSWRSVLRDLLVLSTLDKFFPLRVLPSPAVELKGLTHIDPLKQLAGRVRPGIFSVDVYKIV